MTCVCASVTLALAAAIMFYAEVASDGDVRMSELSHGVLQVYHDDLWGTVCDSDQANSHRICHLACQKLQYR